jgi:hypothetical protein
MEAAVRAKVGKVQRELASPSNDQASYDALRELFDSNAAIAQAAGYGAPGQYKPHSPEWVRRRTLMANLRRYDNARKAKLGLPHGQVREPSKLDPRLRSIAASERKRQATPLTVRDVVRLMGEQGTTSTTVLVKFKYSSAKNPQRRREIDVAVYTHPEVYESVGWPMAGKSPRSESGWEALGRQYLEAFCIAYGIPGEVYGGVSRTRRFFYSPSDGTEILTMNTPSRYRGFLEEVEAERAGQEVYPLWRDLPGAPGPQGAPPLPFTLACQTIRRGASSDFRSAPPSTWPSLRPLIRGARPQHRCESGGTSSGASSGPA